MLQYVQDLGVIGGRRLFEVFPVMSDGRTMCIVQSLHSLSLFGWISSVKNIACSYFLGILCKISGNINSTQIFDAIDMCSANKDNSTFCA